MFVLDIETVPDETKIDIFDKFHQDKFTQEHDLEEYPAYRAGQMSLLAPYAKLAGFGFWIDGEDGPVSIMVGDGIQGQLVTEEMLLKKFWWFYVVDKARGKVNHGPCVGYNVVNFDVKIIRMRSMALGITPSVDLREVKPWEKDKLYDLAVAIHGRYEPGFGMKQTYDVLCPKLEIPAKYQPVLDFTGGMVYEAMQKEGGIDTVRLYQEYDVWREMMLARKTMPYF